jgi:hypothetical protein
VTKKEKNAMKRRLQDALRVDNFDDIGDFADLDVLSKLTANNPTTTTSSSKPLASGLEEVFGSSKALTRAFQALRGKATGLATMGGSDDDIDSDGDVANDDHMSGRKRRRAPADDEELEDDADAGVMEDFLTKKSKYQQEKKAHYTAAPRYGGYEEQVNEGSKRAATYEIVKNKGLTPHRKKENRNPRVKKREKYAKAVVSRKGQVRDVIKGQAASYGGELTGIKSSVSRSRKMF